MSFLARMCPHGPDEGSPLVVMRGLGKTYGRQVAVCDLDLDIRQGEVFGLLGPNGSGKSTVIRMLVGLLAPSKGTLSVAGLDVMEKGAAVRALVGYVPENVMLYPAQRVDEFLDFMGRLRGLSGLTLAKALARVEAQLGLAGVWRTPLARLSHGFRQRVLIAQALLHEPALLVLDEPANGLDPRQIIELRELIKTLVPRHTVLLSSHLLPEIEQVATRVGILLRGELRSVLTLARRRRHALTVPGVSAAAALAMLNEARDILDVRPVACGVPGRSIFDFQLEAEQSLEGLSRALLAADVPVLALHPVTHTLEASFLALLREAGEA